MAETTILTEQHKTAIELNDKIILNATMAQSCLWEMCKALKEMRDSKLYKELGYANFEDYCEQQVGMKRRNAYNYIAIAEKINPESVQPVAQIGVKKLALLTTLSEEQQKEVSENVDLESTSYRELKAEVDKLKVEKSTAESNLKVLKKGYDTLKQELQQEKVKSNAVENDKKRFERKLDEANERITELENRPVEVAVEEDREAKALIKTLGRQLSEADLNHANELNHQRREYEDKLSAQRSSFESQIENMKAEMEQLQAVSRNTAALPDKKEIFKVYYKNAINAFNMLLDFIAAAEDKDFFIDKSKDLIGKLNENLGGIINV